MSYQTPNTETTNIQVDTKEFNNHLKALREAAESKDRRAAADWLANEAEKITQNDRRMDDALYHLTKSTNDEDFQVRRSVWEASLNLWDEGWKSSEPRRREIVLNRVLKVLQKSKQQPEFKKSAADWLRDHANEIAEDERMMADSVKGLLERAKIDELFEVRRSAVEACKAIWDVGWVPKSAGKKGTNGEEELNLPWWQVFRQVLEALKIEECWEVRAAATLWLREKADSIANVDNTRLMTDSVDALIEIAKKDAYPQVRLEAVEACREIWDEGWNDSSEADEKDGSNHIVANKENEKGTSATDKQDKKVTVLQLVLKALENEGAEDDWEIRRTAADWLGGKAEEISAFENPLYMGVSDALALIQILDSEPEEVKRSARLAQRAFWQSESLKTRYDKLTDTIQGGVKQQKGRDDELALTDEIWELANPNYMGSRIALSFLVGCWVEWICEKNKPQLVEFTAEAIRYNRYAVLALIQHFSENSNRNLGANNKDCDLVRLRITKQLADMSNPAFFEEADSEEERIRRKFEHDRILKELKMHAVPVMLRWLAEEKDDEISKDEIRTSDPDSKEALIREKRKVDEIRKNIVRMLGYSGDREAVDALARKVASKERKRKSRQDLLSEYYLEPSKKRNDLTNDILEQSIDDSKRNLRLIQRLNIAVFLVGLTVVAGGIWFGVRGDAAASRVAGALAAVGGLAGVVRQLIQDPLDRIQNALAKLVQLETAFTTFIWGLNLNSTFIQSSYIKDGELEDAEIQETVSLVERSADLAMNMIHKYAEIRTDPYIQRLKPEEGFAGSEVILIGEHLLGERTQADSSAEVYIDHGPNPGVTVLSWTDKQVLLELPSVISQGTIYISLFVDGKESNAVPFRVW